MGLYDSINRLRAWLVNSDGLPDNLVGDLNSVLDAAENQADSDQDYFEGF